MRVLSTSLLHDDAGWRFASTHLKNFLLYVSASRALGIKTSASGRDTRKEGDLVSVDLTQKNSINEQFASFTHDPRNNVRQQLSFRSRGDHRFTAQRKDESDSARTLATSCNSSQDSLLVLAQEGRWQELVVMLTGSPAERNVGTMRDCFAWLGRSGKQKASLTLLEVLKKAGESEKNLSHYFQIFISSFAKSYGAEQGLILCKAVKDTVQVKPNATLFEDLIILFCRQGQLSRGLDLLDEMQNQGLTFRSTSFNPILQSFSDHLMLDEAFETLAAMRRLRVEISLANYNVLIGACVKAGDMEKAYRVLAELQLQGIQPNTDSFHHIIKGFAQQKRLKRALNVVREMDHVGLKPDKHTYLILLRACGSNQDFSEAMKLFKVVAELGMETDVTILSAVIQVYVDNAKLDHVLKLVKELELKGTSIGVDGKSQLLRGLALFGRLEHAIKIYEELEQSGKLPSPESVATLLVALGKVGRMDTMLKIFQESNYSGSWSNYPATYRTNYLSVFCIHICLAYIRHKQLKGAVEFLEHISQLGMTNNRTLYDKIFLQITISRGEGPATDGLDARDGLALLRALKAQGIQPSRVAHEALLDHCASLGNAEEAWEIIREMDKEGLPLNIMSKIRLFRVFVAARNERDAQKVLETVSRLDLLDQDVRLLLQKTMQLEFQRSEAGSAKDVSSFHSLLAIQKQLKKTFGFLGQNNVRDKFVYK